MANPQDLPPEAADALARGNVIEAIRILRQQKNIGLAEAKGLLEAMQRQGNVKVNVTTNMRTVARRPAAPGPGFEQHAGLSPGEVPRGGGLSAVAVVVLLVVIAVGAAIWLRLA